MAFKVLVSPHAAGKIIGRGGSEITALRQQLNVGCHIHGPDTPFPGTGLQVAVLFGAHENIDTSFYGLVAKIAEAEAEHMQQGAQLKVSVVMGSNAVSAVIGTKGATIASLRHQAGCGFSADKDKHHGEQLVRVTGPAELLPAALALLTPFVKHSGDSLQLGMQDYSMMGLSAGWDTGGWRAPAAPVPMKGMGKTRTVSSTPWGAPAMQAIGPGPPTARRRIESHAPVGWRFSQGKGMPAGASGPAAALAAAAAAEREAPEEEEVGFEADLEEGAALEDPMPANEDQRVLDSPSTIAFPIPRESIGRVLGRGGESSERIRSTTGVTLNIEPAGNEGTVVLSGTLAAVQAAHCMVVARVMAKV